MENIFSKKATVSNKNKKSQEEIKIEMKAVHEYFDIFTTAEEEFDMLKEARKQLGGKTWEETDDLLAENFINYSKGKGEARGELKQIFDIVTKRIRAYMENEDEFKALYADILSNQLQDVPKAIKAKNKTLHDRIIEAGGKKTEVQSDTSRQDEASAENSIGYITLLGVGDFGGSVLQDRLQYSKKLAGKNESCQDINNSVNHISIAQESDIEKITPKLLEEDGIFLVVGDFIQNQELLKATQQRLSDKFLVHILNNYPANEDYFDKAAIIKTDGKGEASLALNLIVDSLTISGVLRAGDLSDFKTLLKNKGSFNLIVSDIPVAETDNPEKFEEFTPKIKNIYFAVYADLTMALGEINEIAESISKKIESKYFFVFQAFSFNEKEYATKRRVVAIYSKK